MTSGQSQRSVIVVHPDFDRTWPWAADHFHSLWEAQGQTEFLRLASEDRRPVSEVVADPSGITRAVVLNVPVTVECVARMPALREAVFLRTDEVGDAMATAGVRTHVQPVRAFGDRASQSPPSRSCGLRRIPQLHHAIVSNLQPWDYAPPGGAGRPGTRSAVRRRPELRQRHCGG